MTRKDQISAKNHVPGFVSSLRGNLGLHNIILCFNLGCCPSSRFAAGLRSSDTANGLGLGAAKHDPEGGGGRTEGGGATTGCARSSSSDRKKRSAECAEQCVLMFAASWFRAANTPDKKSDSPITINYAIEIFNKLSTCKVLNKQTIDCISPSTKGNNTAARFHSIYSTDSTYHENLKWGLPAANTPFEISYF
jgi:hypothetical protein